MTAVATPGDAREFDAVVVDVSGGGLVSFATESASSSAVAVVSGPGLSESDRAGLTAAGVAGVFGKPARVRDVLGAFKSVKPAAVVTSGTLAEQTLLELATDAELGDKSGTLEIHAPGLTGSVGFAGGRVVSAHVGSVHGDSALGILVTLDEGDWKFTPGPAAGSQQGTTSEQLDRAVAAAQAIAEASEGLPSEGTTIPIDADRVSELEESFSESEWDLVTAVMNSASLRSLVVARGGDPIATYGALRQLASRGVFGAGFKSERARAELAAAQAAAREAEEEADRAESEARRLREEHERVRLEEEALRAEAERTRLAAADEARRRADEARRRAEAIAEEEARRAAEEQRRRAEEELAKLQAEADALEAERRADMAAAEAEAERLRHEAEVAAASLRAQAEERARALEEKERSIRQRRVTLTGTLSAVGATGAHLSIEAERLAVAAEKASGPEPTRPAAVEDARQRELAALRTEAGPSTTVAMEAPGAGTRSMHAPAAAAAVAAPSAAPVEGADAHDDFFAREPEHADGDLFAEPEHSGPNAGMWAAGIIGVIALIVIILMATDRGETPAPAPPPAAPTAGTGAVAGSGDAAAAAAIAAAEAEAVRRLAEQQRVDAEINGQFAGEGVRDAAVDLLAEGSGAPAAIVPPPVATPPVDSADEGDEEPEEEDDEPAPADPEPRGDRDAERALNRCATTYDDGNYQDTLELCEAAVAANPRGAEALMYLGRAHYELGNTAEAVRFLERAFAIDSRNQNILLPLGAARQETGDTAGAREVYERFLELFPTSRRAEEVRTILQAL